MEFVKVESSQIDSVGFWDEEFGPETLGKEIKNKPEFPFVKVEAGPTTPNPTKETSETLTKKKSPLAGLGLVGDAETDALNPSSALALIDTMSDDLLFSPGAVTDAQLEAGRKWYLSESKKYDISTDKARTELKRFARPLQKLRTGIEARAKEMTGATKRKIAAIDSEKRRLVQIVGGIEDEVLGPLTAWEQEEEARKITLANRVKKLEEMATMFHSDIPSLEADIAEVEAFDVTTMQEYRLSAESAKAAVLMRLRPELERRKVDEAERLELERLRAESAARAEADRLAEQQRQEQFRIDAAVEAAKEATRQEVIAELAAPVVEISAPVDDMPVTTVKSLPITGMVETREQRFHREAVDGLMGFASIDRQTAIRVLTAITKGQVPHITIGY